MNNLIRHTTRFALHIVRGYVRPGDTVIDATCGNGHDTLALAEMDPGRLYAFDVQEAAVQETVRRLRRHGYAEALETGRFTAEVLPHEMLADYFESGQAPPSGFARAILFNLGYLPGGDKRITTKADSTLAAVSASMDLLQEDGLICVTMYSGHEAGRAEKEALLARTQRLDASRWHVSYIQMLNQRKDPPEILLITRKQPKIQ